MTDMSLDIFGDKIEISNCPFMTNCTMKLSDFKQMCFKNGWEGTLWKITTYEASFYEVLNKCFPKQSSQATEADSKQL